MKSFLTKLIFQSLILVTKISMLSDKDLSEPEFYMALLGMENKKSPGNDGLTKEFYVFFPGAKSKSFSLIFPIQL